ncbi:MAG: cysteine desulfurase [Verrucomicrobiae bacterium]|nr:cysteine desulfurase [Verrucomicrobiae bacterium]
MSSLPTSRTDWEKIRADFPILDQTVNGSPLIYFDNGASSQKPVPVIEAVSRFYRTDNANVHRGIHTLSNRATHVFEGARDRTARFINAASSEEIIFTRGTTESINLVAYTWGEDNIRAGDKILLTEMEHHSNIVPWQMLCQRKGASLVYLPVNGDEGQLEMDRLEALLREGVRLFAFTHISNTLGTVNPVAQMCALARKHGVTTLVDAAQSAGHLTVDVRSMDCDFLVFSGHKICAPTGTGVLYGRLPVLEKMRPFHGGGDMIETCDYFQSTFKKPPHRFEAGTPDFANMAGLHAAMDYLDGIGRENIFAHDRELADYAYQRMSTELKGIRILGPATGRAGLISFKLGKAHAYDVVQLADARGIALRGGHHCTQPLMKKLGLESTTRASFYFYNTRGEIDRLLEVLQKINAMFA